MKVELKPGEKIEITFAETDGIFTIEHGAVDKENKKCGFITVTADMPDNNGREGIIYHEQPNWFENTIDWPVIEEDEV